MKTLNRESKLLAMLLAIVVMSLNTSFLEAQTAVNQKKASETEVASKKTGSGSVTIAAVNGNGVAGHIARWMDNNTLESSIISQSDLKIGIGTTSPTSKLTVNGKIESLAGGFKFPDNTIQTTAFKVPLFITGSTSIGNALIDASNNGTGIAVQGIGSQGIGVEGSSSSSYGVNGNSQDGIGVRGFSTNGTGVFGLSGSSAPAISASNFGANGQGVYALAAQGVAVIGDSANSAPGIGVWGINQSSGLAGKFDGNVQVTGTLTKGGGSFKIDHPLDPEKKYLSHSFVESPDMMNIYNGNATLDANGEAVVELPDWYGALNRDARYLLTAIGAPGPSLYIAQKIANNRFKIAGGQAGMEVSWQVTGIRRDAWANTHRIPVEEQKSDTERGYYLHPELFNQPAEKSVEWARNPELMQRMKQEREQMKQRKQQVNQ